MHTCSQRWSEAATPYGSRRRLISEFESSAMSERVARADAENRIIFRDGAQVLSGRENNEEAFR
jgi:hypothetical protein